MFVAFSFSNHLYIFTYKYVVYLLSCSYWANLKLWFKQKISKEEFDVEARRLLSQENGQ